MFAELGAAVIDTDAISHELTAPGGGAMSAIEREFGRTYVKRDRSLDRTAMRELVFTDPTAKKRLEAILHPLIGSTVRERLASVRETYAMLVVPLLFETGSYRDVLNRVVVVDCDESQQIARTISRSRLSEPEVRAIMHAQLPRAERLARADDVLLNDGDVDTLRERVAALHAKYSALAAAAP